ncbi:hypothetical protein IC611_22100 [Proteus mirabilis]
MISVLPRISNTNQEIEMIINLEDGAEKKSDDEDREEGIENCLLLIAQISAPWREFLKAVVY